MLTIYCCDPRRLKLIQRTLAAPYLDGFISEMEEAGYTVPTVRNYVRGAAHITRWLERRHKSLTDFCVSHIGEFRHHLTRCHCARYDRGNQFDDRGAALFLRYLQRMSIVSAPAPKVLPALFVGFCHWMQGHRGAKEQTLKAYGRIVLDALRTIGEDPQQFNPASLRA